MTEDLENSTHSETSRLPAAMAHARQVYAAGDLAGAAAAQAQAVALARAAGADHEALVRLSILLYNLAGLYVELDRYPEAVQAFEEVVALDERTGHPDLEVDRRTLAGARQLAALSSEERARRLAAQPAPLPAAIPAEPLVWAMNEVRQALERGDLQSAVPAQQQVVRLARDQGETPEGIEQLRGQLVLLGSLCLQAEWIDEAVTAYAEAVSMDERLNHADLAADRRALDYLRRLAAMPEPEQRTQLAQLAAGRVRQHIENLTGQAREAAIAVRQGRASAEAVTPQLEQVAAQMEADEPPGSPWREAAAFVRALAALLRGQPLPPVPAAYAGQLAAVQDLTPPAPLP